MARLGREFEKLVARIEEKLCPLGARVKSPDKIPELVSKALREVDASIRYQIGSVPILITVECRDRNSIQDVTWLEQLKSKKDSIGASQTIAVSREGFSSNAVAYAKQHGILLRQLSEITDAFILRCLQGTSTYVRDIRCRMESYGIGFVPLPEDEGLHELPLSEAVIQRIATNAAFARNRANEDIILKELYLEALPEFKNSLLQYIDEESGFNSQPLIVGNAECDAYFAADDLVVETVRGPRYIQFIVFGIGYEIANELMTPLSPLQYTDETGAHIDSFATSTNSDKTIRLDVKFDWDER